jgi:methylenetetrahydrofolate dehydrogenase (NADP+)/methenyltetrahydrofolate cyclohydrolase
MSTLDVDAVEDGVIDGDAVAQGIRDGLTGAIDDLAAAGARPTLATVLMSDDPASETYVSMKQRDCEEVGIEAVDREIDPGAPAQRLYETVEELNDDDHVDGVLVQMPLPDHVDENRIIRHVDPTKDVDAFHPENVGRMVRGSPRFKPCTPHGIQKLLDAAGVDPEGKEAVVIGRSNIVGKPMANLLFQKTAGGNATVTLCHSRTGDLAAKTRQADILIAAAGVPELVDGAMVKEGAAVIDVGINRVERDGEETLVGDVDFESAREPAGAITPVPGGVGPMTRAMLLWNTSKAAAADAALDVTLP